MKEVRGVRVLVLLFRLLTDLVQVMFSSYCNSASFELATLTVEYSLAIAKNIVQRVVLDSTDMQSEADSFPPSLSLSPWA